VNSAAINMVVLVSLLQSDRHSFGYIPRGGMLDHMANLCLVFKVASGGDSKMVARERKQKACLLK
jgi:hypothetical protein